MLQVQTLHFFFFFLDADYFMDKLQIDCLVPMSWLSQWPVASYSFSSLNSKLWGGWPWGGLCGLHPGWGVLGGGLRRRWGRTVMIMVSWRGRSLLKSITLAFTIRRGSRWWSFRSSRSWSWKLLIGAVIWVVHIKIDGCGDVVVSWAKPKCHLTRLRCSMQTRCPSGSAHGPSPLLPAHQRCGILPALHPPPLLSRHSHLASPSRSMTPKSQTLHS